MCEELLTRRGVLPNTCHIAICKNVLGKPSRSVSMPTESVDHGHLFVSLPETSCWPLGPRPPPNLPMVLPKMVCSHRNIFGIAESVPEQVWTRCHLSADANKYQLICVCMLRNAAVTVRSKAFSQTCFPSVFLTGFHRQQVHSIEA